MDLETAVGALRAKGKANTAKIYARHGVKEPCFGVSYADLGALVKRTGVDQRLALGLWKTGNHDARVLATKVADPAKMTVGEVTRWIRGASNYVITDAVAGLAARMPQALELGRTWVADKGEWVSAAGWNVLSVVAMNGGLDVKEGRALLARIRKGIHRSPNRTRYSMNNALIALGSIPELREEALEAAAAVGRVEVDHGETGCKTPDAAAYIKKMAARKAPKRTRVTGARMATSTARRA